MRIDPATAFVSYSREDSKFVLRLARDLKATGAKVWMDTLDIRPGRRWEAEIEAAVQACSRMLVVLSPTSAVSTNVLAEVGLAIAEGKAVIPVLYRECKIPFRLLPFQYADFRTDYSVGMKDLLSSLSGTQQEGVAFRYLAADKHCAQSTVAEFRRTASASAGGALLPTRAVLSEGGASEARARGDR